MSVEHPPSQSEMESAVAAFGQAIENGDTGLRRRILRTIFGCSDPLAKMELLMVLAARLRAENDAIRSTLAEKNRLIDAILAAPRRLAKALGVVRDERNGIEEPWVVIEGSPPMAVQCVPDLDLEDLCPDEPDEPVWAWLIESEGGLVVAGRITPPPLLESGLEQEMTFEGFLEGAEDELEL